MPSTLLIRLEGPLQSWGNNLGGIQPRRTTPEPSQFGHRATQPIPSKSGVLGLCAAALGIDRSESVEHLRQLKFGVRVDRQGVPVTEFQTQPHENPKYDRRVDTRATLSDAAFTVGLEGDPELLQQLYCALRNPHWPLSLGRKSYVLSRPPFEYGPPVPYALAEALSRAPFSHERYETRIEDFARYYVEQQAVPADAEEVAEYPGWDEPVAAFQYRKYQRVAAVTYVGLWGQVFGHSSRRRVNESAPRRQRGPRVPGVNQEAVRQARMEMKSRWTADECRREGLPLYWSQEWFAEEFERLGSLAAMEAAHPSYSNQRLSEWAQRHGINLKPRISDETWAEVDRRLSAGETPGQIARALDISKPSVQRRARKLVPRPDLPPPGEFEFPIGGLGCG